MFSKLELDVRPGSGLGMFEIGKSTVLIKDNVAYILLWEQHIFPQVDVKYDPDTPNTPIILHLRPHLDLLFSGQQQRLSTLSVKNLRDPNPPLTLTYKNSILSSSEDVLKKVGVSRMFGPTYPGEDLLYPGLSFSFDEETRQDTLKSPAAQTDDREQEVKRIVILPKNLDGAPRDALDEVGEYPNMDGELSKAVAKVIHILV
ncbi:hypothetical protein BN946_scf184908.g32 [Trametes cinnabarina]|uniref:Uncharacterized protein n=1 Tax=Pycnoporus cinnabarinus TaxID=5643 RepID=A0A060SAB0_PYCCI|nr:hypothetical protein BN946_scf184908.g32 [Trametes cinnabarina]